MKKWYMFRGPANGCGCCPVNLTSSASVEFQYVISNDLQSLMTSLSAILFWRVNYLVSRSATFRKLVSHGGGDLERWVASGIGGSQGWRSLYGVECCWLISAIYVSGCVCVCDIWFGWSCELLTGFVLLRMFLLTGVECFGFWPVASQCQVFSCWCFGGVVVYFFSWLVNQPPQIVAQ